MSIDRLDIAESAVFDDKGYGGSAQIRRAKGGQEETLVFTTILTKVAEDVAVVVPDEVTKGKRMPRWVRFTDPQSLARLTEFSQLPSTIHNLIDAEEIFRIARNEGRTAAVYFTSLPKDNR